MSDLQTYLETCGARPSSGSEWVVDCPFCGKGQHLYINSEPGESMMTGKELPAGRWICFRCGERGLNFARLMSELDGISLSHARAEVARWKMGTHQWRRDAFKRAQAETAGADESLPAEYIPVFDGDKWTWPKYLTQRRLPREVAQRMKLGVCKSGEYHHRVILPITCPLGRSFTARTWDPDESLRYKAGTGAGRMLYGWETIAESETAVIVEGPFDALRLIEAGQPAVALMGKQLRDSQLSMLTTQHRQYIVMLDTDALEDAVSIAQQLDGKVAMGLIKDPADSSVAEVMKSLSESLHWRAAKLMQTEVLIELKQQW